jgi:tetratricopeptide (TPR) repeat protein
MTGRSRSFHRALLMATLVATLAPGSASADDSLNVLVMRAADFEAQGQCDQAVAIYRASDRTSAHLALIAGRCQVRTHDYAGAVETLTPARELPDASPEVDLYLGIAHYHLGDLDAARATLDRARARGEQGALLELYTGLLQLQAEDARAAALSLERARRADSRVVEPVASYYAFVAWRSVDDEERAEAALARLREKDPNGPWIAEAERLLAGAPSQAPSFWLNAEAGLEYDSNVTVRGSGVQGVFINGDTVSGKDDGRGIWSLDGGVELFRTERWSGGLLGGYTGTAQFDINEFDTHYPTASAWIDYYVGPRTTLRGRYDYAYAWINYDPYLSANTLSAQLFQGWEEAGQTELTLSAGWFDFKYDRVTPPSGSFSQIDQDGTAVTSELLHRFAPKLGPIEDGFEDLELRASYRFTHYVAEGSEFDYDAHRFLVGFDVILPFEVAWDAWGAFTYQPYKRTSVYAEFPLTDAKHRDRLWEFGTELEKFVAENVSVLARYRFADTGANTDAYDYDRHVVGGYVRIRFR